MSWSSGAERGARGAMGGPRQGGGGRLSVSNSHDSRSSVPSGAPMVDGQCTPHKGHSADTWAPQLSGEWSRKADTAISFPGELGRGWPTRAPRRVEGEGDFAPTRHRHPCSSITGVGREAPPEHVEQPAAGGAENAVLSVRRVDTRHDPDGAPAREHRRDRRALLDRRSRGTEPLGRGDRRPGTASADGGAGLVGRGSAFEELRTRARSSDGRKSGAAEMIEAAEPEKRFSGSA